MIRIIALFIAAFVSIGTAATAHAYVGPGAGLSLLGALWGLLLAVGAALLFVILWPVRQMMKKARSKKNSRPDDNDIVIDENTESPKR